MEVGTLSGHQTDFLSPYTDQLSSSCRTVYYDRAGRGSGGE